MPVTGRLTAWRQATRDEVGAAARRGPTSGTWWSTPPRTLAISTSAWADLGPIGLWLIEDSLGWTDMTASPVTASPSAVFEVADPAAWVELVGRYPLEVTPAREYDWSMTTGVSGRWLMPDWSRVAEDYDAVHLTIAGYLRTSGRALAVGAGCATVLAGWDPDATYWLTDEIQLSTPMLWHREDLDWDRSS